MEESGRGACTYTHPTISGLKGVTPARMQSAGLMHPDEVSPSFKYSPSHGQPCLGFLRSREG